MKGRVQFVLHGHMPYVLHHGTWPHGSHWLYEAALEVYLPLLALLSRRDMALTLGLTPVLLTQLRSPSFVDGFYAFLREQLRLVALDKQNPDIAEISLYWEELFSLRLQQFSDLKGDIVGGFVSQEEEGRLELLSSFATHGYAPLLSRDESIEEQLRMGLAISRAILGFTPKGIWLPECAFSPQRQEDGNLRRGVDRILEEEGVSFFYVEDQAFVHARSEGLFLENRFYKVDWDAVYKEPQWAWRSLLEPHWVSTVGGSSKVAAFAREPALCAQLWSAEQGYPGDPLYLEFHKKSPQSGIRYWRVTDRSLGMEAKKLYSPQLAQERAELHAFHFVQRCAETLDQYAQSGRNGVLTCCFDAELFGHWWHEGVHFLEALDTEISRKEEILLQTGSEILSSTPPDKVVWLPECSWGAEADHRTWLNHDTHWIWNAIHNAEHRYHAIMEQMGSLSEQRRIEIDDVLCRFRWNFLLLQASDWPFVISTKGAVDYGFRRFSVHLERFERFCLLIEKLRKRESWNERDEVAYKEICLYEELPIWKRT
jgi:1,4-alpha-glucan branching enzyme